LVQSAILTQGAGPAGLTVGGAMLQCNYQKSGDLARSVVNTASDAAYCTEFMLARTENMLRRTRDGPALAGKTLRF